MRIKEVTEDAIIFDNGKKITYSHDADCHEYNWADFSVLNPNVINYDYDFDEDLEFRVVDDLGFVFGCISEKPVKTEIGEYVDTFEHFIFIPCYSDQNGYYSTTISIYYDDKCVIEEQGCCYERVGH